MSLSRLRHYPDGRHGIGASRICDLPSNLIDFGALAISFVISFVRYLGPTERWSPRTSSSADNSPSF